MKPEKWERIQAILANYLSSSQGLVRKRVCELIVAASQPEPLVWKQGAPEVAGLYLMRQSASKFFAPGALWVNNSNKHEIRGNLWFAGPIAVQEFLQAKGELRLHWECPKCGWWNESSGGAKQASCEKCKESVQISASQWQIM